ncbi:MAG: hypothetical protein AB7N99_09235 [Simkaniaceae bacterium]|jgi:hypothetical protein
MSFSDQIKSTYVRTVYGIGLHTYDKPEILKEKALKMGKGLVCTLKKNQSKQSAQVRNEGGAPVKAAKRIIPKFLKFKSRDVKPSTGGILHRAENFIVSKALTHTVDAIADNHNLEGHAQLLGHQLGRKMTGERATNLGSAFVEGFIDGSGRLEGVPMDDRPKGQVNAEAVGSAMGALARDHVHLAPGFVKGFFKESGLREYYLVSATIKVCSAVWSGATWVANTTGLNTAWNWLRGN